MSDDFRPIVFTDLDDTLFQSERKVPAESRDGLRPVAGPNDDIKAVMTRKQQNLLRWLVQTTQLIPVTARSRREMDTLSIGLPADFRIASNGAVVINPDGTADMDWHEMIVSEMSDYQDALADLHASLEELESAHELSMAATLVGHDEMVVSLLFSALSGDGTHLEAVVPSFGHLEGWMVHHNGNTLALTPPPVSKKRAVAHVLSRMPDIGERPVFGIGDSISDLGFMAECDFITAPRLSQIGSSFRR